MDIALVQQHNDSITYAILNTFTRYNIHDRYRYTAVLWLTLVVHKSEPGLWTCGGSLLDGRNVELGDFAWAGGRAWKLELDGTAGLAARLVSAGRFRKRPQEDQRLLGPRQVVEQMPGPPPADVVRRKINPRPLTRERRPPRPRRRMRRLPRPLWRGRAPGRASACEIDYLRPFSASILPSSASRIQRILDVTRFNDHRVPPLERFDGSGRRKPATMSSRRSGLRQEGFHFPA